MEMDQNDDCASEFPETYAYGLYGPVQAPPRVGNEYQIKLPSMITGSDYFDYMRNPMDEVEEEEANEVFPSNFLIGLDIPIVRICHKPKIMIKDLGNMKK